MILSGIPIKYNVVWASGTTPTYVTTPTPVTTTDPQRASLTDGFPPTTFEPEASGGNPPLGKDMNGALNQATGWLQWFQAGGAVKWDSAFSAAISGYPAGALVQAATIGNGSYWLSSADGNATNPDAAGAGWIQWPDLPIQLQKPNYGTDTGATNAVTITLSPAPTSWAQIVGAPIRFKALHANTTTTPTIKIGALTAATMVNSDGTPLSVGQYAVATICEGIPRDDGTFQLNTPGKGAAAATAVGFFAGCCQPWWNETVPSGWLELNGQPLFIATFPDLYAVLGTRYGGGGSFFNLPDCRGEFLRGWDHARGLDPNAGARTNSGGGFTGDHVGTNQAGAAGPINLFGIPLAVATGYWLGGVNEGGDTVNINYQANARVSPLNFTTNINIVGNSGSTETRPVNIYCMWIIKY